MAFTILEGNSSPRSAPRPMTEGTPGRYGARPYTGRETLGALAFLVLFGLPFAAGGVFALSLVPARWAVGDLRGVFALCAGGLAFVFVGCGLMAGAVFGRHRIALEAKSAWEYPDEPWKWRPDWAQGHVTDGSKNDLLGITTFAILWNLVAFPAGVLVFGRGVNEGQPYAVVALLFPAFGLGLAAWAVRAALRVRRFGVSRLVLDAVPVPVGRTLSGTVRTRFEAPPEGGFAFTLSALRTTRGGPDNDTSTRVLWQEEAHAEGRLVSEEGGVRVVAPVAIRIPSDAPSTDHSTADDEVAWRLEVTADAPGVDYRAVFEVPVYRTDESDRSETARAASHLRAVGGIPPGGMVQHGDPIPTSYAVPEASMLIDTPRPEPCSAITVAYDGEGVVIDLPAGRNPGIAFGLSLFGAGWSGAIAFLVWAHAPILFPIVFGLFDLLIGWIALSLWCEVARVRVHADGVRLASGIGQPGPERWIPGAQIADVRVAIGMTANTTAYYDLKLVRADGRTLTAGSGIRHKREAEWLAAQIMGALAPAAEAARRVSSRVP